MTAPDAAVIGGFVAQTIRISVPYTLAAVGASFSERGGVVNIALEGILLIGAFAAVLGTWASGDPWIGLACAVGAGLVVAALHALVAVTFRADQIISGVAINLLAVGLTKFLLKLVFGSSSNSPRIPGLPSLPLGPLAASPVVVSVLGNPLVLTTALVALLSQPLLFRTRFGLRLRAAGEQPEAADSAGLSVGGLRYAGVLVSGALAGLGATEALQITLQGGRVPTQFLQMLPYVATIVVLAGVIGRAPPPAAVGVPYRKEEA